MMDSQESVISVRDIVTRFGSRTIHDGVSLTIKKNEIFGILGESGSGKSVLMKEMIMLLEPNAGEVTVLGQKLNSISYKEAQHLRREWGVLFQFGALFSSMTIAENIVVQIFPKRCATNWYVPRSRWSVSMPMWLRSILPN